MSKAKKQKKVLGRGLAALLDDSGSKSISFNKTKKNFSSSEEINIEHIEINPNQPRLTIDSIKLENLSNCYWLNNAKLFDRVRKVLQLAFINIKSRLVWVNFNMLNINLLR